MFSAKKQARARDFFNQVEKFKFTISKGHNKLSRSTNKLQRLTPFISRHVAKQPNYPENGYIFSPELVASITEYALNKTVFVYAATDMP